MSTIQHRYAQINGIRMHYATAGDGPPVVMLHGFPEFWYGWHKQIPALAERYSVIVPDQRGYGETDKPSWGYEVDVLVQDIIGLIEASGHQRARIVGHDWGGVVAWALAIRFPQRVERLAILNTPHPAIFPAALKTNPRQAMRSMYMGFFQLPWLPEALLSANDYALYARSLRRSAATPTAFSDEEIERYKDAISTPGALTGALNWYRAAGRSGGLLRGTGLKVLMPTLLIWGERDTFLGKELIDGTERFVPDLRVLRMPDCSHWLHHEAPEAVNRALIDFLG
jgi:pimeloyl-ACP methyl ester carboxylesterase